MVTDDSKPGPTAALAGWIAQDLDQPLPDRVTTWAKHALLDWFGVALGGSRDSLVQILVDDAMAEGGRGESRLIGLSEKVTTADAALINGASSHALDFDDLNKRMEGHPSVAVAPAVLTLAENQHIGGRQTIEAFVVGHEAACHLGDMMGPSHDERGFHSTATLGTFGAAAAAAARLLRLDTEATTRALGMAATQASGLQSMFGTMSKPLHAGRAAMNGLLAARWASRGLTSNPAAIECPQGFAATQSTTFEPRSLPGPGDAFAVESTLFKHHAACFLTHAAIDAAAALRRESGFALDEVRRVRVRIPRIYLRSCNIARLRNGLEVKFSIGHVVAMTLAGLDTGDASIYDETTATRSDLIEVREKVYPEPDDIRHGYVAELILELANGTTLSRHVDAGVPEKDLEGQWQRLQTKFRRLAEPVIGRESAGQVISFVAELEEANDLSPLLDACARTV